MDKENTPNQEPLPREEMSMEDVKVGLPSTFEHEGYQYTIKERKENKDAWIGYYNCSVYRKHSCGGKLKLIFDKIKDLQRWKLLM